ncbi:siderophore-interacting protein [Xanthobacter sp. V4C-4]|uniref:siderophore-interacting protein n=1 Tax=Xanthobacter cornucopiae TaxID=3119924 RepID=UPI00372B1105
MTVRQTNDATVAPAGPRYRHLRVLEVVRVEAVTARTRRIVLGGPEVAGFGAGPNLKLLIPPDGLVEPEWPLEGPDGRPLWPPEPRRPVARTYSVRRFDAERGEVSIDFALHGQDGPAARFVRRARAGDTVGIAGPGGRGLPTAPTVLLAGDHSGLPSIAAILERLPPATRGLALLEVDDAAEEQDLAAPPGVRIAYLHRNGAEAGTTRLLETAVRAADLPAGDGVAAWVACESAAARALRAHLRDERGLSPRALVAVGYWKRGMSETAYHAAHDHDRDADYHRAAREEGAG